ncbi:MAG: WbqC family protein [Deltaproteobacteria bacterium]|nr:WbqC family protein [Deltaproteobacteria bacterium]
MILAVHQPQYLPWLGYFDKMDVADVFCYLDNVQYKKNEWQNRNRIKTPAGPQWLTVPVTYGFGEKILEVGIDQRTNWGKKHINALVANYAKAPYFDRYIGFFRDMLLRPWEGICELNMAVTEGLREILGLSHIRTVTASQTADADDPTERLIGICKRLSANTYLAGAGGAAYMETERFCEAGIKVIFQSFDHPEYPQRFGQFISHLSIVDLLMNCGDHSMDIIRSTRN